MTHEKQNIGGGAEHPGSDEQMIAQILGDLRRVEAPSDFEFRLKARIANAKPSESRPASLFPVLKYAVPLALLLFVTAGVILNSTYNRPVDNGAVAAIDAPAPEPEKQVSTEAEPAGNSLNSILADGRDQGTAERPKTPAVPGGPVRNPEVATGPRSEGPRVRIFTGGNDRLPRVPKEFTVTPNPSLTNTNQASAKSDDVRQALSSIGVAVELEGGAWQVRSVGPGRGSELGVRPGDRVEAIDGQRINADTAFRDGFRLTTMTVRRDGVELELRAKP